MPAAEEAPGCGKRRRVRCRKDEMTVELLIISFFEMAKFPQRTKIRPSRFSDNSRITVSVKVSHPCPWCDPAWSFRHRKRGIQQQHALVCPFGKVPVQRGQGFPGRLDLLENIDQRRRFCDTLPGQKNIIREPVRVRDRDPDLTKLL